MEFQIMGAVAIVLLNQKGGVGKTSACHHLAGAFAKMKRRVLLMDNDPQGSLTQGLLGPDAARNLDPFLTIYALYHSGADAAQIIQPTGFEGIDLIPGNEMVTEYNTPRPHLTARHDHQFALKEAVDSIKDFYDLILIDCPPNLHLCSWAALTAADRLIIPLQPEDYGAQGIRDVHESIRLVREQTNPGLMILGYLVTMWNARRSIHKMYDENLRELYGAQVFETRVPHAAEYPEAIAYRRPISMYKPKGMAARAIQTLAEEILSRLTASSAVLEGEAA
jgi:chromosome partitioning protein